MIQRFLSRQLVSTCSLAVLMTATVTPAQSALPEPGVPQSVGVQLKTQSFNIETINQVHDMGFRVFRRGIYWDAVEKEKGKYNFSAYDEQLNHAKQKGFRVVACLFGGNKLHEDDGRGGIQTEEGRVGFAAFAAAAAAHYKDHNLLWEIWNEPNVRTFWRKDGMHNSDEFAQEYTDLVKAVVPAMLKADPNAFVMAGSVSNYWQPSYNWTEACFKKGILSSGIKAWSVHPYGVKTPEEFAVGHGITRDLLKKYGAPNLPMINTERGFAIKKPQGQLELEGWSGGEGAQVRNYQAAHFVRQFMADQLHGVALTIWYEWGGDEFGIVGKDGIRPIETAARFMNNRLNGYKLDQRLKTDNPQDYLVLWKDAAGNRQLVAWTSPPAGGSPDEARPHEVTIKTSGVAKFEIADMLGKATTVDTLKLTVSGLPQYVALPADAKLGEITTAAPAPLAPAAER
jgi:polysaccharide biosynthesis protein PslG